MLRIIVLLFIGAALVQADPAPFTRDDAAAEKLGWLLATKAYTFRTLTLEETIEISRSLGVKYLEVNPNQRLSRANPVMIDQNLPPERRVELRELFTKAGIKPVSMGVIKLTTDETLDRSIFAFAKELGLQTLVSEPPPEAFELLDKLTDEYGIKVAIHNHPKPSPYALPETELAVFKVRSERIGSCSDVGHWTRSGLNPVDCLRQLAGRVIQLHFKDVDAAKKDVPWGTGTSDVPGMLRELHRQNFRGVFSMEYEGAQPSELIDDLKQSITTFDKLAGEIASGH